MQTQVIKLCCQGCGADLSVNDGIRFLTCNYCHSKLEVVRDASTTHTKVLEKLEHTTDQIAGKLQVLELQNELERIDREWEMARQSMLVKGKDGHTSEPSAASSVIGGLIAAGFGVFFAVGSGSIGAPFIFPLVGVIVILFGLYTAITGPEKASEFEQRKSLHQQQRGKLLAQIAAERRKR